MREITDADEIRLATMVLGLNTLPVVLMTARHMISEQEVLLVALKVGEEGGNTVFSPICILLDNELTRQLVPVPGSDIQIREEKIPQQGMLDRIRKAGGDSDPSVN